MPQEESVSALGNCGLNLAACSPNTLSKITLGGTSSPVDIRAVNYAPPLRTCFVPLVIPAYPSRKTPSRSLPSACRLACPGATPGGWDCWPASPPSGSPLPCVSARPGGGVHRVPSPRDTAALPRRAPSTSLSCAACGLCVLGERWCVVGAEGTGGRPRGSSLSRMASECSGGEGLWQSSSCWRELGSPRDAVDCSDTSVQQHSTVGTLESPRTTAADECPSSACGLHCTALGKYCRSHTAAMLPRTLEWIRASRTISSAGTAPINRIGDEDCKVRYACHDDRVLRCCWPMRGGNWEVVIGLS